MSLALKKGDQHVRKSTWIENYTPSRLEWLAFVLNSLSPYLDTPYEGKFKRAYTPKDDGKTLILMVNYPKDSDLEKVETYIEHVTKYVKKVCLYL